MTTHHPAPQASPGAVLAAARKLARQRLTYGYFRSIQAMTTPYVYCPHLHKVETTVPAAATPSQVCAALLAALTDHLVDNNETPVPAR